MSHEFHNMKATSNGKNEIARGFLPSEMSRPMASSRAGFMESAGCGVQLVMTAELALEMGLPIYGIVAYTHLGGDGISRSVPAPGQGILTAAREAERTADSPLLNLSYRRAKLQNELAEIDRWRISQLETAFSGSGGAPAARIIEAVADCRKRDAQWMWNSNIRELDPLLSPMRSTLATWGLTIDDIRVASFHGTSTKANDKNESQVVNQQMTHLGRSRGNPLLVICQKYLTGHPKGAAGAWMLNGCLQVLNTGIVPGNRNLDDVEVALEAFEHLVYPSEAMQVQMKDIKACMLTSFGFGQKGGLVIIISPRLLFTAITLEQYDDYRRRVITRQTRIDRAFQLAMMQNTVFKAKNKGPWPDSNKSNLLDPQARLFDGIVDTSSNKSNLSANIDINTASTHGRDTAKRQRSRNEDNPPAACDQCRSRKVRCDRQQPECSNCRKAAVFCSWSNTFRRVNHTKQLRDDFSSVMDRLDEVHQTLNQLTSLTHDIVARPLCSGGSPGVCGTRCATACSSNSSTNMNVTTATTAALTALRQGLHKRSQSIIPSVNDTLFDLPESEDYPSEDGHFLQDRIIPDHQRRKFDSPASLALIQGVAGQISSMITHHNDKDGSHEFRDIGVRVALQHLRSSFPFESACPDPKVLDDNRPVSTPPRLMVDLFIESFLCSFNASLPIFDEAELRHAVDSHYAAEHPVENSPWALIFTNIVVLGLGLEAQAASVSKTHPKSMHHELMSSFLRNCDRAIANLDSFTIPSVINIQALLTLALVGKEFYGNSVFEKACQNACHLARIVGLHQSQSSRKNAQGQERSNQDRLFRVLYTMDKYRTFLTGRPCDLYLFDSELPLNNKAQEEPSSKRLNSAFDHMMRIWEEIYLGLYSARASLASISTRGQRASNMSNLVTCWAQQYGGVLESSDSSSGLELAPRRLELKYCYHITQVLILRCDPGSDTQRQVIDHARACLRVIASVIAMPVTTLTLAYLTRMLQNYPIASFTELLRFHLQSLGGAAYSEEIESDDIELFRYISGSIKAMQHPDSPQTYLSRLGVGINWLLQVLETVGETARGSLNVPDNQAQPIPMSYVDSSDSCLPSHPAPGSVMPIGDDSGGLFRPTRGFSLASSISSSSEREQKNILGEAELTSFGVSTPLTDPMSTTVGQESSSNSSLYLDGPPFGGAIVGDRSWGMNMDLWKDVFPT
ncbi:hypothetical protein NUW58_g1221 [Xylaria curta]|uniref:Uncharacterized protein n=1 Tax=Xylaria curta TaxID=42375 RepID=A0ACC1PNX6_9PEZI|nr:hypothetical protein NUW58_g1221 [Xylaria curta]